MTLARVAHAIVASHKAEPLRASRLLVVQPLDAVGRPTGAEFVALDPGLDAGPGDVVLLAREGAVVADLFDAARPAGSAGTPANVVIVAVLDPRSVPA